MHNYLSLEKERQESSGGAINRLCVRQHLSQD